MAILKLYKFLYPVPALALTACYTDFTPKEIAQPVLCVNALVTAGEPIETKISHTWTYTDIQGEIDHEVNDAGIEIYVNGTKVENDYCPNPGDLIKIEATSKRYGYSAGEVTVPVRPSIGDIKVNVTTERTAINQWVDYETFWDPVPGTETGTVTEIGFSFSVDMEITVSDPSPDRNYFRLASHQTYDLDEDSKDDKMEVMFFPGRFRTDSEPIFSEHLDPIDAIDGNAWGFTFFTDRRFEMRDYTIHVSYETSHFNLRYSRPYQEGDEAGNNLPDVEFIKAEFEKYLDMGIELNLETISESYYNWANYAWQIDMGMLGDLSNVGLTDPIWAYSNTTSGAGIIVSRNPVNRFISLRSKLLDALNQSLKNEK
ncbi:MAG: DUF4249 domain-containing protein [Muribaculaceae bacterium]|nr:DUF4249 domain-containing protein [Muribaculaceae bacterium]